MILKLRLQLGEGTCFLQIRDENTLNPKIQDYAWVYSKNNGSNMSEAKQTEVATGKVS